MLTPEVFVLITVLIAALVAAAVLLFLMQRKINSASSESSTALQQMENEFRGELARIKAMHTEEIDQLRSLSEETKKHRLETKSEDLALPAPSEKNLDGFPVRGQKQASLETVDKKAEENFEAAEDNAQKVISEAEIVAKSIVAEAQETAKQMIKQQQQDMQKNLAKMVIQVTKKVVGKTLTYNEHQEVIEQAIKEL